MLISLTPVLYNSMVCGSHYRHTNITGLFIYQIKKCYKHVLPKVKLYCTPHVLCGYLIELASLFMSFYEACPILKDGVEPATRNSRLMISQLVSRTLATGLDLLGIEVMEKM